MKIRKSISLISDHKRFYKKISAKLQKTENGCHEWTGAKNYDGYGVIWFEGYSWATHRVAYELANGAIPQNSEKFWVLHKCDNPSCCNPEHLYVGSPSDNARDCAERCRKSVGWRLWASQDPNFDPKKKVGTVYYEYKGEIKTLTEWSELFGINAITLNQRFMAGWREEDIPLPANKYKRHILKDCNTTYKRFSGIEEVNNYLINKEKKLKENKVPVSARIPDWMKSILENSAIKNDRNFSLELINRVRQSLTEEEKKIAGI